MSKSKRGGWEIEIEWAPNKEELIMQLARALARSAAEEDDALEQEELRRRSAKADPTQASPSPTVPRPVQS